MNKSLELLTKSQKSLLILFPLIYLVAGFYFRNLLGNLSLRSCDPDYIYFMSGLTLSDGTLKLGHFDNPGTPLQVFLALTFKLVYFFRATATPYVEDVFLHSDLYLSVGNMLITALTAAVLFFSGRAVFKVTDNIFSALLIQTTPFLPVIWYDLIGRIAPELMLTFPVILLTGIVIKTFKKRVPLTRRDLIVLACISAFGLSVKLTFLPLWLIPVAIIEGWKRRAGFAGLSVLLFLLFAFPATLHLNFFWGWIKNLFLHSGQYGGGETNIVNFTSLRSNLQELFNYERQFFYVCIGLIALFAGYLVSFRKKADKRLVLIGASIILTVLIQLLMVGKHYAHRYFIPVLMMLPLLVYFITELTGRLLPRKMITVSANLVIIGFIIWSITIHCRWLPIKSEAMGNDVAQRSLTWHYASLLDKESYRIITSQNYGCPFIEYILMYSTAWANNAKKAEYATVLGKLFPYTYTYSTWDNSLRFWGEKFNPEKIIESGRKVCLYLERNDEMLYKQTVNKLVEENGSPFEIEREQLYLNPKTTEIIYSLTFKVSGPGIVN